MKKKLFGLMVLVLLLLVCLAGAASAAGHPDREELCPKCNEVQLHVWNGTYYTTGAIHSPEYRCNVCGEVLSRISDNENHTGGTATCTEQAECEVCGASYGDPLGHIPGAAVTCTTDQVCIREGCGAVLQVAPNRHFVVTVEQTDPDCVHPGRTSFKQCCVCVTNITEPQEIQPLGHSWGEWQDDGQGAHFRECQRGMCGYIEITYHTGGTATCTEQAECEVCGAFYGDPLDHVPGEEVTCTTPQICIREGCGAVLQAATGHFVVTVEQTDPDCVHPGRTSFKQCCVCVTNITEPQEIQPLGHNWGEWQDDGQGAHFRECQRNRCGFEERTDHSGGMAACEEMAKCSDCGAKYGEALGHDYAAVVTEATCTDHGYTTYTCSRCGNSYNADRTAVRGHWYDLWYSNPDGTHSAECKRYGCSYVGTAECTLFEITVKDGETETLLTVCPVCGDHEETPFDAIPEAIIKAVDGSALPRGEQIVRGMEAPFDGVLYAFTAAYEYSGKVEPFNGIASVTLPLDAEKYADFKLVRVDVTPATENTERTEVWTDIAFACEDGQLTFDTDAAGLFLLLPVE